MSWEKCSGLRKSTRDASVTIYQRNISCLRLLRLTSIEDLLQLIDVRLVTRCPVDALDLKPEQVDRLYTLADYQWHGQLITLEKCV